MGQEPNAIQKNPAWQKQEEIVVTDLKTHKSDALSVDFDLLPTDQKRAIFDDIKARKLAQGGSFLADVHLIDVHTKAGDLLLISDKAGPVENRAAIIEKNSTTLMSNPEDAAAQIALRQALFDLSQCSEGYQNEVIAKLNQDGQRWSHPLKDQPMVERVVDANGKPALQFTNYRLNMDGKSQITIPLGESVQDQATAERANYEKFLENVRDKGNIGGASEAQALAMQRLEERNNGRADKWFDQVLKQ